MVLHDEAKMQLPELVTVVIFPYLKPWCSNLLSDKRLTPAYTSLNISLVYVPI